MSVSERIIKRREELGFSQTELAKRAGLKPPAISQYESGARSPSYEALIKLSNALNVSADFLMSGAELNSDVINDKTVKILLKVIQSFSNEQKELLLDYAKFVAKSHSREELPIFNESTDYASYLVKSYFSDILPIDVYDIAKKLNISIYEDNLKGSGEGILLNGENKVIILDNSIKNLQRKKFTVAILLGHAVIPWHVKTSYEIRKKGSSTLLTEDVEEMEAQQFAANLIMPSTQILKDFAKIKPTIDSLKKLASDKYDVSLFTLMNRLVKNSKDKYAVVQSESWSIITTHPGSRPLVEEVHNESIAATFFSKPSLEEETRVGTVPAYCWLKDANLDEVIYEESIFNPNFGKVLTLLTIGE